MKRRNIYEAFRSLGWWLEVSDRNPFGPSSHTLAGRYYDVCRVVADREGVSLKEAHDLLMTGYLARWIESVSPFPMEFEE